MKLVFCALSAMSALLFQAFPAVAGPEDFLVPLKIEDCERKLQLSADGLSGSCEVNTGTLYAKPGADGHINMTLPLADDKEVGIFIAPTVYGYTVRFQSQVPLDYAKFRPMFKWALETAAGGITLYPKSAIDEGFKDIDYIRAALGKQGELFTSVQGVFSVWSPLFGLGYVMAPLDLAAARILKDGRDSLRSQKIQITRPDGKKEYCFASVSRTAHTTSYERWVEVNNCNKGLFSFENTYLVPRTLVKALKTSACGAAAVVGDR